MMIAFLTDEGGYFMSGSAIF